jgi:hypothetical protein
VRKRLRDGVEGRFEDVRVVEVAALDAVVLRRRADAEAAALLAAQQRAEDRRAVEARPAEPVNAAVLRDERGAAAVSATLPSARARVFQFVRTNNIIKPTPKAGIKEQHPAPAKADCGVSEPRRQR